MTDVEIAGLQAGDIIVSYGSRTPRLVISAFHCDRCPRLICGHHWVCLRMIAGSWRSRRGCTLTHYNAHDLRSIGFSLVHLEHRLHVPKPLRFCCEKHGYEVRSAGVAGYGTRIPTRTPRGRRR